MSARYYVDGAGVSLGAFIDAEPPEGAVEVPGLPQDIRQTWDATAQKWSAAPAPVSPRPSPREWLERLPADKQAAIAAAGMSNAATLLWLMKAVGSSSIDVTLPETIAGVAAFVAAGVLTAADQSDLLAP